MKFPLGNHPRILLDLFMFSTLMNEIVKCESNGWQLPRVKAIPEKRIEISEHAYRFDSRNESRGIWNENVLLTVGFDKMLRWIFDKEVEKGGTDSVERRFGLGQRFVGHRKRLQFALLPIMYKMGVMTTLLTGLTVLALKGLTIGVILLIFAFGNYFTKLHKSSHQNSQPIHVHVHSQDGFGKVTSYPSYESEIGLAPWDRSSEGTEVPPSSYLQEQDWESYRRRILQNLAALKFKPLPY